MELDTGELFKLSYGMAGTWVFTVQAWGLGQGPVPSPEVEGCAWRSAGQPDGVSGPLTPGCECHRRLLKHTSIFTGSWPVTKPLPHTAAFPRLLFLTVDQLVRGHLHTGFPHCYC